MLKKRGMEKVNVAIGTYTAIRFEAEDRRLDNCFYVSLLSEIQEDSRIEYLKIGDIVVKTTKEKDERGCVYFYYEDHFIGIQTLSEIVSDFFSVPIHRLFVSGARNINDPRRAIDWIMGRQETIAQCSVHWEETSDEDLTYFLDTSRITKKLSLFVKTSENFQYSFKYPMNLETMIFHQSSWPTIKNLFETNPRYLEMLETKFTNEDMNLFIRNWMNGGNSNLGTLIFRLKQLDVQIIMNEIPFVSRETPNDFIYNMPGRNKPHYFESIMEVRNVNGVVASIVAYIGVEKFYFFIYVWPDWKGQPYPLEPIV